MKYADLIKHLERKGKMKLLPKIARELRIKEAREKALAPRKETAKQNPSLISGWRTIEDGVLVDHSAKQALLDMYQNITN